MSTSKAILRQVFPWGRLFLMIVTFNLAPFPLAEIAVPQCLGWWQHFGLGSPGRRLICGWLAIGLAFFVSGGIEVLQSAMLDEVQSRQGFFFQDRMFDNASLECVLMAYAAVVTQVTIWFLGKSVGLRVNYPNHNRNNISILDGLVLMTGIAIGLAVLNSCEGLFVNLGRPSLDLPENSAITPWLQILKLAALLAVVHISICLCVTFPATLFRIYRGKNRAVRYWARISAMALASALVGWSMTSGEPDASLYLGLPAVVLAIAWAISWESNLDVEFSRNRIPVIRNTQ